MEPFNKEVVRLVREAFLSRKYNKNVRVYPDDKDNKKEVCSFTPDKDTKIYPEKIKTILELTTDQRSQIDQMTQEACKFFDQYLKKKSKENACHFLESALNSYSMANDLIKFERIDCVYACFEDSCKVVKEDLVRYVVICYNIWICYLELNELEIGFTYLNRCLECFAKMENDEMFHENKNELNSSENNTSQSDLELVKIQKTQKLLKHYKLQANESLDTFLKHLQNINFSKEELNENGKKLSRQQRRQQEKKQAKDHQKSEKNKDVQIEELRKKMEKMGLPVDNIDDNLMRQFYEANLKAKRI